MGRWDLGMLARAAEGKILRGAPLYKVAAVATDTRSLPADALFVALRGERFDGHDYLTEAVAQNARALLVDKAATLPEELRLQDVVVVQVDDTQRALGDMARAVRRVGGRPVVGVTGSNGKTTTKELCAAALGAQGAVHCTQGNLNNLIGVPMTLFAWPDAPETWAAVVEMGMNRRGEIARLAEIAEPSVGVVTNVAAVHLEGLGSIEEVAEAKAELFAGLRGTATAVVNEDDTLVKKIAERHGHRKIRFGTAPSADIRIEHTRQEPTGIIVNVSVEGKSIEVHTPLVGRHNAHNVCAALGAAMALGVDLDAAAAGMRHVQLPDGRLRLVSPLVIHGMRLHLLDDTYNANPHSMHAAFIAQRDLNPGARRVAVLGDMFELGPETAAQHARVGRDAAACGVDIVFALGACAEDVSTGARAGGAQAHAFLEYDDLEESLEAALENNDHLLIKGSRGMRMERVVRALMNKSTGVS